MQDLSESARRALRLEYFGNASTKTFMLIDGASAPSLIDHLYDNETAFSCLFSGELEPDLHEVAPYLVELQDGAPFAEWVITHGFGEHWGIVLRSSLELAHLLRRFRQLLFVRDEHGDPLYFRFYDPRVLRVFLPTCQGEEIWPWFDNIDHYLVEGEEAGLLLRFSADDGQVKCAEIRLAPAAVQPAHARED